MKLFSDFLPFLSPLPFPEEMREWDAAAYRAGFPPVMLMENAARAAFEVLRKFHPSLDQAGVWLFMGGGNNGGDAACLARHLLDAGAAPLVFHAKPLGSYRGAAAKHIRLAKTAGVRFTPLKSRALAEAPGILVDGLLGTGFKGELRPPLLDIIKRVNELGQSRFVMSLDIPSGLDGISGAPSPAAVRANATASFAAAKPGLVFPWAKPYVGELHVRSIGIPRSVSNACRCGAYLLDRPFVKALPPLPPGSYKNRYGHVLIIGGRPGLDGAAQLAARGALRAGAGLITIAAPEASLRHGKGSPPEIMTMIASSSDAGAWASEIPQAVCGLCGQNPVIVMGPGMGRSPDAAGFLAGIMRLDKRPPLILDADALFLLAQQPGLLALLSDRDILTPHPGEAGYLLGKTPAAVQQNRFQALDALCSMQPGAVILKGAGTLIGQAGFPRLLLPFDIPQMAVAGSGDVLAGCLGGVVSRTRTDGWPAICQAGLGALIHALAGEACAASWPDRGNGASEIADAIAQAWRLPPPRHPDAENHER